MGNPYDRDIASMSRYERREREAISREQIVHIDPREYAPGTERFERLWQGIEQAHRNSNVYWAEINL